jgi:hypothetical protein
MFNECYDVVIAQLNLRFPPDDLSAQSYFKLRESLLTEGVQDLLEVGVFWTLKFINGYPILFNHKV